MIWKHKFDDYVGLASVGAASGVAGLDANGVVPSSQLPSFVDDVLRGMPIWPAFPSTGDSGKIYVAHRYVQPCLPLEQDPNISKYLPHRSSNSDTASTAGNGA